MIQDQDFTIFPAIHLRAGQVIRFTAGDLSTATVYSSDPVACARNWIEQGATWLQLVNLDAAFDEAAEHNWQLVKEICQLDVKVQFGGGIRSMADIDWAIESGIDRVIIGTAAVEDPRIMADAIAKYGPEQIVLAIDSDKSGKIRTHGWRSEGAIEAISFGRQMRHLGVMDAVYTNINRDGSMSGVDWQSAANLASYTGLNIIAGGGVGTYDDIIACYHQEGIGGVVIGRALYAEKISLSNALETLKLKISFDRELPKWKEDQLTTWAQLRYKVAHHNIQNHLPQNRVLHILDAGGGNGREAIPLAKLGHQMTLLDSSPMMLNDAGVYADEHQVANRITYRLGDIEEMESFFESEQFDVILCHNVLHFSDRPDRQLNAMFRTLKPGGFVSILGINRFSTPYRKAFFERDLAGVLPVLESRKLISKTFKAPVNLYSGEEIGEMLTAAGLAVESQYGVRCITDYWGDNDLKSTPDNAAELEKIELGLTGRHPYYLTARFYQVIGRKGEALDKV